MMAQMRAYHSARLMMPVSCHFLRVGICKFHRTGIGKATIRASSTALMMATEMTCELGLPQVPPLMCLFQLRASGRHMENAAIM